MNTSRARALFKREITDVLRDKKTLVMMVVIPMILYPILIVIMTLMISTLTDTTRKEYCIAFVDIPEMDVSRIKQIIVDENPDTSFVFKNLDAFTAAYELNEQRVHSFVTTETDNVFIVNYLSARNDSVNVQFMLMRAMEFYLKEKQLEKIAELGLDKNEILRPISFSREDLSTVEESVGSIIGGLIPALMILSILMGVIFPAIDVTAGEKERGTLETLITLPITNFEMIVSKFLAVALVACVSALLNVLSIGVAIGFMGSMILSELGMQDFNLVTFVPAILVTIVVMLFFSLFVTAVCLFVCLFAKSFKEANNYSGPIMMVFVLIAYMGMLPDLELSLTTAGIPIINITLMIKQLFSTDYNYTLFGIVLISNVVYSFLMMWLLAKVYKSEVILFGEGFSGVKIFSKRCEIKAGEIPGFGDVIMLLSIVFLLQFYVGSLAQVKLGFGGLVVTQAIFLIIPLLYSWYLKNDRQKLFAVKIPKFRHLLGALIAWAGIFLIGILLAYLLAPLMPDSLHAVYKSFAPFMNENIIFLWLVIALMPAVGEELMFRGFIFGTLKDKMNLWYAMIITSVIFGIFHMSLIKFFTTFMLGFIIVLAVQASGSIFIGMLIHLVNNSFAIFVMKYPDEFGKIPFFSNEVFSAAELAAIAVVGILLLGAGFIVIGKGEEK